MNDYAALKEIIDSINANNHNLLITLMILVTINIVIEIIKFFGQLFLSNKEKSNKKRLLIEEKSIKILEQLYQSLDGLTLFDKSDEASLLDKIKEINLFVTKNRLYIPNKFRTHTNNILDYFKNVLTDFRLKDIKKESELFEKYSDDFNS